MDCEGDLCSENLEEQVQRQYQRGTVAGLHVVEDEQQSKVRLDKVIEISLLLVAQFMEPRNRFHFNFTLLLLLHMSCFASRSSCALTIKLSYPKAFEIEENFHGSGASDGDCWTLAAIRSSGTEPRSPGRRARAFGDLSGFRSGAQASHFPLCLVWCGFSVKSR